MRIKLTRKLALFLVAMLCIPVLWSSSSIAQAATATPKFAKSKIELTGVGEMEQLIINNKVAKSTYKWTSSDQKVATVSTKGIVTTKGGGTATIKCKITYPSKGTKTISCKVVVTVPADSITISNAILKNGAHVLTVGGTYNFDSTVLPANTTDKVFWSVKDGDTSCIRIDNATEGTVTAMKAGKTTLVATTAANEEAAKTSIKNYAIIIEVVAPSATIKSAEITGSTELKVVFDSPVDKSTVIDSAGKLTNNIAISMLKDAKNVVAGDPGALTPTLSSDGLTLTIASTNMFTGIYGINFTNGIKNTSGIAVEPWYTTMTYIDTAAPVITNVSVDDSGFINTITFSEVIDITNLKSSNASVSSGTAAESSTLTIINNKLNYSLSTDKKSLIINLGTIAVTDYNKAFTVILSGIKDLSGNVPPTAYYTTLLRTDSTPKPQAVPISIVRTSYNVLTATFSRAVLSPGTMLINNSSYAPGVVDGTNKTQVNYTISDADAALTGGVTVMISGWNSYNVITTDTSAVYGRTFTVNFATDNVPPILVSYDFDATNYYLTLTYSEPATLANATGVISSTIKTLSDEIRSGTNVAYTNASVSDDKKVIRLKLSNMTVLGTYTFTLNEGFVTDGFRNKSASRTLSISNGTSTSTELPPPYAIAQSTTNLSQITVDFANRIDVNSAQTVSNYYITGVSIQSAVVTKNTADSGATVLLTVADSGIDVTVARPITIKGILGYNASYSPMASYTTSITLNENKKPTFSSITFDNTTKRVIKFNFSENIQGTFTVQVKALNTGAIYSNTVTISGSTANITLDSIPPAGTYLNVLILTNALTDTNGNSMTAMSTNYGVVATY